MTPPVKKISNKFIESVKKGFNDIKLVMEEGNYKLFLKQFVVIIVIFLAYRYINGALEAKSSNILGQIDAIEAQFTNEKEYMVSKQKLMDLEPRFPDLSAKNDWLLRQIVAVFRDSNVTPTMGSAQAEDTSNSGYTVASIPVTAIASFGDFARLLANIENKEEYVRVSEFTLNKNAENLGQNDINIRINTIFPQEKIAAKMFKDAAGGKK